ncbi:hypothetical protein RE6C_00154 [Rhodopirellula europaea 6C]|uniref:Uncharacterized protein n=1 Tax=Rhodopirellula europaea 6C TaxID=1263867 RepID=M2A9V5_9BACT|nr:hypothetical protein RE6C_00154 [Rhodopirellula europaea 6C]
MTERLGVNRSTLVTSRGRLALFQSIGLIARYNLAYGSVRISAYQNFFCKFA